MSDDATGRMKGYRTVWQRQLRRDRTIIRSTSHVGFVLSTYGDSDGTNIRPGVAAVAADAGLNEKTVRLALTELHRAGWLVVAVPATRVRPTEWNLSFPAVSAGMTPADRNSRLWAAAGGLEG